MDYKDALDTSRIYTRFLIPDDATAWIDYFNDPVNCRFMSIDLPTNEERSEFLINSQIARYSDGRLGLQAVILKDTDELVGMCGLLVQEVDGQREIEIGYHFLRRYWSNGYATEAAQLFRNYGFEMNIAPHIISMIDPRNEPSKKVARRNGMKLYKADSDFRGSKYEQYRITQADWVLLKK